jgi:hypothetical protein
MKWSRPAEIGVGIVVDVDCGSDGGFCGGFGCDMLGVALQITHARTDIVMLFCGFLIL